MDLEALMTKEGAMLAAGVFGITLTFRKAISKALGAESLKSVWIKLLSALLPLLLGPSLGLVLLHRIEAWQERILLGLVAATIVVVGRNLFKLSGQVLSEHE